MNGSILHFDPAEGAGVIAGDDGRRYSFRIDDWRSPTPPGSGTRVDIVPDEQMAREIFILPAAASSASAPAAPVAIAPSTTSDTDWAHLAREKFGAGAAIVIILASFLPFLAIPILQPNLWSLA